MLDINRVLQEDHLLRAFTRLNHNAFDELSVAFEIVLNQEAIPKSERPRKWSMNGGRKAGLQRVENKLFFILFYFKYYPTFDVAGVLFDLHHNWAHRWKLRLQPLLLSVLGEKMVLPERKLESIENFTTRFPSAQKVMIDGTEPDFSREVLKPSSRLGVGCRENKKVSLHPTLSLLFYSRLQVDRVH